MSTCRYCRASIMWAMTEKGHRIPLDPSPSLKGNVMLDFQPGGVPIATVLGDPSKASGPLWLAHMATCPGWKKRHQKKAKKAGPHAEQATLPGMIEAVASGISTLEHEFLANVVMQDGRTIGQAILPRLSEAVSSGRLLGPAREGTT
jgi:hypothetical protein